MIPIEFEGSNAIFGKEQDGVNPLPCFFDGQNLVVSCWKLDADERREVLRTGRLFIGQMLGGTQLQPILPSVKNPIVVLSDDTEGVQMKVVK